MPTNTGLLTFVPLSAKLTGLPEDKKKHMRTIVIEPTMDDFTPAPKFVEIDGSLKSFQGLVGGYIEAVRTNIAGCDAYINDEGKLNGLPLNILASHICPLTHGDYIVGTMVLVGPPDNNGDETDVDEGVMEDLLAIRYMQNVARNA